MDPVSLFAMFPGWIILVPTTPFDYMDAPAASVNALDIPLAVSGRIEKLCLPNIEQAHTIRVAARREI